MLLNRANTIQAIKTAKNPAKNDLNGFLPAKYAAINAAIAITHQGKKYPPAKDRIKIIRNNI